MSLDKPNSIGGFVTLSMKLLDSFGRISVSSIHDYNLTSCFVGFQLHYHIEEGELREIQFLLDPVLEKAVILQIEERVNIYQYTCIQMQFRFLEVYCTYNDPAILDHLIKKFINLISSSLQSDITLTCSQIFARIKSDIIIT